MHFHQWKRRDFVTLLGGAAALSLSRPLEARAQQPAKLPTIGFLGVGSSSTQLLWFTAFAQRLRELGWTDGRNVAILVRWAEGRNERFAEIAAEFVALKVIGVVTALLIADKPLGFVALVGVIALVGMDVRNSVVLMVQIEAEITEGRTPWDAVVEATMHRFRPILLTSTAAALGMVPIATTVFWGPFAIAIIGGLIAATMMTLISLPALYVLWFRVKEPSARCLTHVSG